MSGGMRALAEFLESAEADSAWNDRQRLEIEALRDRAGEAWLGVVNARGERKGPTLAKWDGELVLNFGADFVVPCFDPPLDRMLRERDAAPYTNVLADALRVKPIFDRVVAIGGIVLVWT